MSSADLSAAQPNDASQVLLATNVPRASREKLKSGSDKGLSVDEWQRIEDESRDARGELERLRQTLATCKDESYGLAS